MVMDSRIVLVVNEKISHQKLLTVCALYYSTSIRTLLDLSPARSRLFLSLFRALFLALCSPLQLRL